MYESEEQRLDRGRGVLACVRRGGKRLSYAGAIEGWRSDEDFRTFFIARLARAPFSAFRWETPPITSACVDRPFEYVLLDGPGLDVPPDPAPFRDRFAADPEREAVTFPNLGRDAELVAPLPRAPREVYGHLAAFSRGAPAAQNHALWRTVGDRIHHALDDRPLWVSTAGGGVAWLHVRLDRWPKYYGYGPYRAAP